MSREAFEAWWKNEGLKKATAVGVACKGASGLSYEAWQAALAWAYEDAARVCLDMANERPRPGMGERSASIRNQRAAQCHDAIRERAKEVTR